MGAFEQWFSRVMRTLATDDEACLALIRGAIGEPTGPICTIQADLTPPEALACARTLLSLGRRVEATELVAMVMSAALEGSAPAQGDQRSAAPRPQGSQLARR